MTGCLPAFGTVPLPHTLLQNTACIKGVLNEIQFLHASMQLMQARMAKLGKGASDEGSVKSKVRCRRSACARVGVCCTFRFWCCGGAALLLLREQLLG